MRNEVLFGMVVLLSACAERPGTPAVPARSTEAVATQASQAARETSSPHLPVSAGVLSAQGIGAVRFGMSLAEAEQAQGGKATLPEAFDPACSMVRLAGLPKLRFMVENGIVTRADAEPGIRSNVGLSVGDELGQVLDAHPEARLTPHKYDANARYVSFPSADGQAALILEETGGKVSRMRAGLQPAVGYVETCG